WAISVLSFVIIQLPPGDFVDSYIASLSSMGGGISQEQADAMRVAYGADQPMHIQYVRWMAQVLQGNYGISLEFQRPVQEVIGDRLVLTIVVSLVALVFTWALSLPIGIISAVRQYSAADYIFTFIGFIGLAVPNFLVALLVLYFGFTYFNASIGGLFSPDLVDAPWGWLKIEDLLAHLPVPAIILGLAGSAQAIRIMRANLLDELRK